MGKYQELLLYPITQMINFLDIYLKKFKRMEPKVMYKYVYSSSILAALNCEKPKRP